MRATPVNRYARTVDDDNALVERLRARDEAAFTELVLRWSHDMIQVAERCVRSRAVAEDVVQDTWILVLNAIDGFEGRSSLRTWVFTILSNRARDVLKRDRRTIPFSSLSPRLAEESDTPDIERFMSHAEGSISASLNHPMVNPDGALIWKETVEAVGRAIARLPEGQRQVVALRVLADLSRYEVCQALSINVITERTRMHRARNTLCPVLVHLFPHERQVARKVTVAWQRLAPASTRESR
jgi:RNA polymerase sigma-70 factor, ECF subfamily